MMTGIRLLRVNCEAFQLMLREGAHLGFVVDGGLPEDAVCVAAFCDPLDPSMLVFKYVSSSWEAMRQGEPIPFLNPKLHVACGAAQC